ncbi:hypothetical protein E2C01_090876 [Portunus trituberculatus]|uniref:Uncharacterized protein n=1 Tax=Portunus trituberculatus TaxID=210409 RepID=A0A5B7JMY0_PORTR|nr:hypothetical protein [Portunus trituberculatus]
MPAPVAEAFISLRRKDNIDVIREKMIGMIFTGQPHALLADGVFFRAFTPCWLMPLTNSIFHLTFTCLSHEGEAAPGLSFFKPPVTRFSRRRSSEVLVH